MRTVRRLLPLLALPFALFAGCSDKETESSGSTTTTTTSSTSTGPIDVPTKAHCNILTPSDNCLLPFPSRMNEVADKTTPTGVKWNLDPEILPKRGGETPLDVKPFNTADGASPVVPILAHFGFDVDLSKAPGQDTLDASVDGDTSIAIFNMDTGKRVRFFAEMDANRKDGEDGRYALILRPVEPMEMGSRTVVVMRDDRSRERARSPAMAVLPTE